ncbi:hypothetical protein ACFV1L_23510 [Kitasatospora sp. NPDC059646]|uniref:hypothetical protein n=1 Tax=Kitasatospora sp. NPDC059646 TaxID=3346893 RepID=UPI0036A2CC17
MADTWDTDRLIADGFEYAVVEHEWCDGPRAGLAPVEGVPHYFRCLRRDDGDEPGTYQVWPASAGAALWEREWWAIFAVWNARQEAGDDTPHPDLGGVDVRYDALGRLLVPHRRCPAGARQLIGELRFDDGERYRADGTDYWFRWRPVR